MKNIVGQVVRKHDFWDRPYEISDIWDAIDSGSHILLCAPRRVGKTSIMYKLLDKPQDNYLPIYIDTESADNQSEFWKKLFNALLEEDFINSIQAKAKSFFAKVKGIKISRISAEGVEFGDGEVLDYQLAFERLIKDLDEDKKLIIMIDEFAQTIENIIQYEDTQSAINLLKIHRELRQNRRFSDKVTFIYAGSIGLESVVAKVEASKHINDLNSIKIHPLPNDDALQFTQHLLSSLKIDAQDFEIEYMLEKIEWLIPFYIQLIVQELKKLYRREPKVNYDVIDEAIHNALGNRNHFESWQSKLKTALEKEYYLFAKEVLNAISEKHLLSSLEIYDIAAKYSLDDGQARECLRSLDYDGYINNNDDAKVYRFNSPILRMWWNKYVAN